MAGNERHEFNMVEELPVEVLARTLGCMDIASRVKLASCNKALQTRVYRDCAQAWRSILFQQHVPESYRSRLTDYQLSTLLTRVNARDVTTLLYLTDCDQIRGPGLAPLRNSSLLRDIDLRGTAADENPIPFLTILRTMIPHKLTDVTLDLETLQDPVVVDFFQCLREAKMKQVQDEGLVCAGCHDIIPVQSRQCIPNRLGHQMFSCLNCDRLFCRRGSCPTGVRECGVCYETYCNDCDIAFQCYLCGKSYCNECSKDYKCNDCGNQCCQECDDENDEWILSCNNQECCRYVCRKCAQTPEGCENDCLLCLHCQELGSCSVCKRDFCVRCTDGCMHCIQCSKSFCGDCMNPGRVRKCGACQQTYCNDCREFEHCDDCDKYFCKDHNRMLDCESCSVRHCRRCGYTRRGCKLCASSCFDGGCVCIQNNPAKRRNTSMPKQDPVKRRRIS